MLDRIADVITATEIAIKSGFNIPPYAFNSPEKLYGVKGNEIIQNGRMYFKKPDGYDLSYILFWTGKHFHGGYISLNSNYAFLDRGFSAERGFVLFASHLPEIKKKVKRLLREAGIAEKEGFFIRIDLVLQEDGTLVYWGADYDINKYIEAIELLTEYSIDTIASAFMEQNDIRIKKPEGYVGAVMFDDISDGEITNRYCYGTAMSIKATFKQIYSKLMPNKNYIFLQGYEKIFSPAFHILKKHNKIS